jgi:branched-subunit amino acid ABC-type transport system permease component
VNALVWLGNYISTEHKFLKASTLGLGLPAAALGAWAFNKYGDVASVLVVPLAFVGAYVWGLIMWRLMFRDLYARKRALKQQTDAAPRPERRDA